MICPQTCGNSEVCSTSIAGTIGTLAESTYETLLSKGYSLAIEEVEKIIVDECQFCRGWSESFATENPGHLSIDSNLVLSLSEWVIIEPVVQAACDEMQANRMEGTRSMGTEQFGLSVGEAKQIYNQRRDELPKMAFVAAPFSIDLEP